MKKLKNRWLVGLAFALGMFAQDALAQEDDIPRRNPAFPRDVHGLWWQPGDPGWATALFDHQTAMSSALLVYDRDGSPIWFFAPRLDCYRDSPPWIDVDCAGPMYSVRGSWFGEPFRSDQVRADVVGEWSGKFSVPLFGGVGPDERRTLHILYSINGATVLGAGDWPMEVQTIDEQAPRLYLDISHSGLWGRPDENGWGVGLFQQGNKLVATLFVHGRDGRPRWYVVHAEASEPALFDTSYGRFFQGDVYETRGHPYGMVTTELVSARRVGSASLRYGATQEEGAQLSYSIDGVQVSKTIYRLP